MNFLIDLVGKKPRRTKIIIKKENPKLKKKCFQFSARSTATLTSTCKKTEGLKGKAQCKRDRSHADNSIIHTYISNYIYTYIKVHVCFVEIMFALLSAFWISKHCI